MNITVVYPAAAHSAYGIAAKTFAALSEQVFGISPRLVTDADSCDETHGDVTVLIGNDAVNDMTAKLYLSKAIDSFGIRYCTDDYCIRSTGIKGKRYLFLAGGRPRATIYAVYRYFERFCGCRWFWDGDRLPKTQPYLSDMDLTESPRFDYRGIRYFAHRSLHRFQAEHWSLEDWQSEIDWILKKRLNLLMLRIGMDDVFQKAFPDVVSYPERDKPLPETGTGYNDRTLFWSLEYRGELRRKLLQYAFERDLMHPEDCGTMSHWYSRTPLEFLDKVKPSFLPQANKNYNDPTGLVWDIRNRENLDYYFKLTEAHIREYGKPEIFHTIGLGERLYSDDPEENRRMKLYVYRKIVTRVKEQYPNAPLLIASWDLWMHFTSEEVRELVAELDPGQSLIFDYTSDTTRRNNFTKWGVVRKFPWVFGIFSGYEPNSEIRGFYGLTNERFKKAKEDPMCKGAVLWPELSHGDSFVIEYFAQNAWDGETPSIAARIDQYCADRYPKELSSELSSLWHRFMPIVELTAWSVDDTYYHNGSDLFPRIFEKAEFDRKKADEYRKKVASYAPLLKDAARILLQLSKISTDDEMTIRDLYDIARTIIGRYINASILQAEFLYATEAPITELTDAMRIGEELTKALEDLLGSHKDYSLLDSLERLRKVTETNPNFEETLKNNAECRYCRAYIYENTAYLYLPEMKLLFSEVEKAAEHNAPINREALDEGAAKIREEYFNTPLAAMKKDPASFSQTLIRAAELIGDLELLKKCSKK